LGEEGIGGEEEGEVFGVGGLDDEEFGFSYEILSRASRGESSWGFDGRDPPL